MESSKRKNQGFDEPKAPKAKRLCALETKRRSLKLVDLNEDVLEKVFSYLDAQELVNIVECDNVFLCSSRRAFKRKYKTKNIRLPISDWCGDKKKFFMENAKLLRHFGESISKLEVIVDDDSSTDRRIFHLMITHCRETLTELKFYNPSFEFDINKSLKINKSFTKLNTLIISHGYELSMLRFHKSFPMLENLVFDCVDDVGQILSTIGKIASLKCLSLNLDADYEGRSYHIEDLNRFFKCNPQLNELRLTLLDFNIDTDERWFRLHDEIITEELMTLKLNIPFDEVVNMEHSKALAQLKIPNDRIAHLEVRAAILTAQICTYVAKCSNLKTLKVGLDDYMGGHDEPDPFQQAGWKDSTKPELLTQLEIVIECYYKKIFSKVGLNAIRPYLKQSKNLTTIKVRCVLSPRYRMYVEDETNVPNFDGIRSRIDLKIWSFTQEVLPNERSFTLKKITE